MSWWASSALLTPSARNPPGILRSMRELGVRRLELLTSPAYLSRCHTILRKSVLPGNNMLGAGSDSITSLSPSIR